ncbi:MAG: hypothetical protein CBC55_02030 [Gammaproteobacteria bacterium TMED95]|nr:MAG: hypothetical protein CBC55_02030 [Gammaproteobacteria bacterium TMED95]
MNTQHQFYLPKNDDELNAYVSSINTAYGDGFDFKVGEKRSEKLRDVICKHLGFTSGYQQLQAHWRKGVNDLLTGDDSTACLIYADAFGPLPVAMVASPVAKILTEKLNELFPCSKKGFYRDDEGEGSQGWGYGVVPSTHALSEYEKCSWVPLYMGSLLIGYTRADMSRHRPILIQGLISGAWLSEKSMLDNLREFFSSPRGKKWGCLIDNSVTPPALSFGKVLSLRMSSMETSVIIPLQGDVEISSDAMSFQTYYAQPTGISVLKNFHVDADRHGTLFVNGIGFDFASIYDFNPKGDGFVVKNAQSNSAYFESEKTSSVEWFGVEGVEIRKDDNVELHNFSDGDLVVLV